MSTVEGFLPKNSASRYHRIHIPKRLRAYFGGKAEVWRSLSTTDAERAEVRVAEWGSRSKQLFLALKRQGHLMNQQQIETLVAFWLERELDEAEDARAICGPVSDAYRDDVSLILSDQFQEASEALVSCDYRKTQNEADALLRVSGLPALDHTGAPFRRLCRRLLLAKQKYTRIEADRWEGVYETFQGREEDRPEGGHVNGTLTHDHKGAVSPKASTKVPEG